MGLLAKLTSSYRLYHALLGQFSAHRDYLEYLEETLQVQGLLSPAQQSQLLALPHPLSLTSITSKEELLILQQQRGLSPAIMSRYWLAQLRACLPTRRQVRLFILLRISHWPLQEKEKEFLEAMDKKMQELGWLQKEIQSLLPSLLPPQTSGQTPSRLTPASSMPKSART